MTVQVLIPLRLKTTRWGEGVCTGAMFVGKSEDNLQEIVLSFHHVSPQKQTGLVNRYLYPQPNTLGMNPSLPTD